MLTAEASRNLAGKRILITGGCGFIGSHFVEACVSLGMDVVVLDNMSTGHNVFSDIEGTSAPSLTYICGDITERSCFEKLPGQADIVIHLAAAVSVAESVEKPEKYRSILIDGSKNVFEYAYRSGASVVLSASSAAVYGDCGQSAITEDFSYAGISPYAHGKYQMEELTRSYAKSCPQKGISFINTRFFNVYGPRQDPKSPYTGVMSIFLNNCMQGSAITIFGSGEQTRDFVYVGDVVEASLSAIAAQLIFRQSNKDLYSNKSTSVCYNIGTGSTTSINSLAELVKGFRSDVDIAIVHAEKRAGDILHSLSDPSKICQDTKWRPQISIDKGLAMTWAWFCNKPLSPFCYAACSSKSRLIMTHDSQCTAADVRECKS